MKASTLPRKPAVLSESTQRRLGMYALAASAAGVGALALAPSAEAKIVYTPKHVQLPPGKPFPIDLDHNGKIDFYLLPGGFVTSVGVGGYLAVCHAPFIQTDKGYICTSSTFAKNALNQVRVAVGGSALALRAGANVEHGDRFGGKDKAVDMGGFFFKTSTSGTRWGGPWMNGGKGVKNRYLGLKFRTHGHFHFGWARLTVTTQKRAFTATLTGYAYETVPNKAIVAGKTKGPDVVTMPLDTTTGTLGHLALGRK